MSSPKRPRTDSGQASGSSGGEEESNRIIVQSLPHDISDPDDEHLTFINPDEVVSFFSTFGACQCLYLRKNGADDYKLGENFAVIQFDEAEHAAVVWEVANDQGLLYKNKKLMVTLVSENKVPINVLTDDCLDLIFSRLNLHVNLKVEQVCKRWKNLTAEKWARQSSLDLEKESGSTSDFCKVLMRTGMNLKTLAFPTTCLQYLVIVGEYCTNVESMKVSIDYEENNRELFFDLFNIMFTGLRKLLVLKVQDVKAGFRFDFVKNLPRGMKYLIAEDNSNPRVNLCIELQKFNTWNRLQLIKWAVGPNGLSRIKKWFVHQNDEDIVTIKTDETILPLSSYQI